MTYLRYCTRCRAEGHKTESPYDPRHHDAPLKWREEARCFMCNGTGYRPATEAEIRAHKRAGVTDYTRQGVFAA